MATSGGSLSTTTKLLIRAAVWLVAFFAMLGIPVLVFVHAIDRRWLLVCNILFYLAVAVLAVAAIVWIFRRVRDLAGK